MLYGGGGSVSNIYWHVLKSFVMNLVFLPTYVNVVHFFLVLCGVEFG